MYGGSQCGNELPFKGIQFSKKGKRFAGFLCNLS
jgi:hypothetical protein